MASHSLQMEIEMAAAAACHWSEVGLGTDMALPFSLSGLAVTSLPFRLHLTLSGRNGSLLSKTTDRLIAQLP
jgi:hypothetical protein